MADTNVDIDCRGLKCPEPVLKTRKALAEGAGSFTVLVDNESARDNVSRFARTSACEVEVTEVDGGFLVAVTPGAGEAPQGSGEVPVVCDTATTTVIFVSSDEIGSGERELGTTLMKSFIYAAVEADAPPSSMVFMNSGVRLVTENEETIVNLMKLADRGVDILVCGTCLDYYKLKESLKVGRVSNMYEIQSELISAARLVCL
jgi:selenium metabolism protein YedF